ncbi:hypothetical protein CAOG_06105 [Capsaspora owczarzaki ATCC 30864]|uniref:RING-type domain-containing protein n=1 Tax=Capsaspora owczarzaki (strain ATCC 30864) TaxID=595528 RepID=A0A0D2WUL9_CAPO3|nr:hypothetical protein CAOG_06105 [Capsaspora owczarzaki ATCC 30864]KJE95678.1 hypothetical protein CAOG_006105 [Capsaspora owczarzaki ATCC 30864]|eukprot:XP_004345695.1 hypothetical protein CAOG_06105 [Capsaspora owczarzaki ATCC 30864]
MPVALPPQIEFVAHRPSVEPSSLSSSSSSAAAAWQTSVATAAMTRRHHPSQQRRRVHNIAAAIGELLLLSEDDDDDDGDDSDDVGRVDEASESSDTNSTRSNSIENSINAEIPRAPSPVVVDMSLEAASLALARQLQMEEYEAFERGSGYGAASGDDPLLNNNTARRQSPRHGLVREVYERLPLVAVVLLVACFVYADPLAHTRRRLLQSWLDDDVDGVVAEKFELPFCPNVKRNNYYHYHHNYHHYHEDAPSSPSTLQYSPFDVALQCPATITAAQQQAKRSQAKEAEAAAKSAWRSSFLTQSIKPYSQLPAPMRATACVTLQNSPLHMCAEGMTAGFGAPLAEGRPIVGELVPVVPDHACQPLAPPQRAMENSGWVALVRRGDCSFMTKIANAEAAGASSVIVYNDNPSEGLLLMQPENTVDAILLQFQRIAALEMLVPSSGDTQSQVTAKRSPQSIGIPSIFITADSGNVLQSLITLHSTNTPLRVEINARPPLRVSAFLIRLSYVALPLTSIVFAAVSLTIYLLRFKSSAHATSAEDLRRITARLVEQPFPPAKVVPGCDVCVICLEAFVFGSPVVLLDCRHCYHRRCIGLWLETSRTCPMCKHDLLRSQ